MRKILISLVSAAVAYGAAFLIIYNFLAKREEASRWVDHTNKVVRLTQAVLLDCVDMETGYRGYALAHKAVYLEPYRAAENHIQRGLLELKNVVSDNPIEVGYVEKLTASVSRFKELLQQFSSATATILPQAKATMDDIRQQVVEINATEATLLQKREAVLTNVRHASVVAVGSFSLLGLLLLVWAGVASVRALGKEALERLVAEKTAELRQARDEAIASRVVAETALAVRSRFLSTVSHEVRSPMAGIIGLTEILTMQDLGTHNNATVNNIFESSKRLLQILNDVLDAARMESGNLKLEYRNFPLRAVLGEVRQLVIPEADKKKINVTGACEAAVPEMVCGDELRVRQILLNLAFNAVKFSDTGHIDISATLKERDKQKTVVRFTVTDTGIGIKPEDQTGLFEPFAQGQDSTARVYGGTGLGLSISKSLVEMMGGEIGVKSDPSKGSTFWFEIPFLDASRI